MSSFSKDRSLFLFAVDVSNFDFAVTSADKVHCLVIDFEVVLPNNFFIGEIQRCAQIDNNRV